MSQADTGQKGGKGKPAGEVLISVRELKKHFPV